jgi:hypothetical protein
MAHTVRPRLLPDHAAQHPLSSPGQRQLSVPIHMHKHLPLPSLGFLPLL